jgi:hypothetical protein
MKSGFPEKPKIFLGAEGVRLINILSRVMRDK